MLVGVGGTSRDIIILFDDPDAFFIPLAAALIAIDEHIRVVVSSLGGVYTITGGGEVEYPAADDGLAERLGQVRFIQPEVYFRQELLGHGNIGPSFLADTISRWQYGNSIREVLGDLCVDTVQGGAGEV